MSSEYQKLNRDGTLQGVQKSDLVDDRIQMRMRVDGEEYGVSVFIGDDIHKAALMMSKSIVDQYEKLKREKKTGHDGDTETKG